MLRTDRSILPVRRIDRKTGPKNQLSFWGLSDRLENFGLGKEVENDGILPGVLGKGYLNRKRGREERGAR